jgi:DNA processing protein
MYMKGDINLNNSRVISIVGTRNATEYGREMTETLISDLASKGIDALIVSGLAYGIDVIAHKAAMKFNLPTLGVVGHGLDRMYPAAHASIAKEMVQKNGGLLSDFPSGSKIDPGNFLRRNRIVAGLADCTVVIESGKKGGALVTADIASSYNRDVMAFPGKTTDAYSSGCNDLIKQNKAALIENADDLITLMGWTAQAQPIQQALFIDLTTEEQLAMELLRSNSTITVDELARSLKKTVQQINTLLLSLEFSGLVKALPGNRFKIVQKNYQATPPISPF